ncbi:MAG: rhomboid family intramembrane serine protease [Opitutaceae bacterium]|nr:rhomboid family intramembrane serine protease [Opitutaceae bacterium]
MLAERPYMRGEYRGEKTSALTWLLSALAAGFLVQLFFSLISPVAGPGRIEQLAGLTPANFRATWGLSLLTHGFLHSTTFIFHALGNGLLLWYLGRELIPILGPRRLPGLLIATNVLGAFTWLALHWQRPGDLHLGATAAVSGLFVVFACFNPAHRIDFLLFFLWPVSFKMKHAAFAWLGFTLLGFVLHELPATELPFQLTIAHSAHLGGMLVGYAYFRWVHNAPWFNPEDRAEASLPRWLPVRPAPPATATPPVAPGFDLAPPSFTPAELRAEVDRILDKIGLQGLASLTPAERQLLDDARSKLPRR